MQIRLIFSDWWKDYKSCYHTKEGVELTKCDFHAGSMFMGTIELDDEDEAELVRAIDNGYMPVFWVDR